MKKRILSLAMAAVSAVSMLAGGISASAAPTQVKYIAPNFSVSWCEDTKAYEMTYKLGDLDRDGYVTVSDISILSAYVQGRYDNDVILELANGHTYDMKGFIYHFGDMNQDEVINVTDVSLLAAQVKGIKSTNFKPLWGLH